MSEMIENFWKSFFELSAINSYRRTLWIFLGIAFMVLIAESQTQFLEYYSLNQQADLLAKVSVESGSPKITAKVEEMQLSILQGIDGLRKKRERPVSNFVEFFMLFLKGAWVMLPFAYLGGKFAKKALIEMHNKLPAEQLQWAAWFGFLGFSSLAWFSTILGLVSILFNRGNGFVFSWIVFPVCSLVMILMILGWFALLKAMVPSKTKVKEG